jgi:hypothetical protein
VDDVPSQEELDLLANLIEDGWPLVILGTGKDEAALGELQALALSLVRQGLAGIYGRPEDARDVPRAEAEAIILEPRNWEALECDEVWMISTTEAGNALLGAPNEWRSVERDRVAFGV